MDEDTEKKDREEEKITGRKWKGKRKNGKERKED